VRTLIVEPLQRELDEVVPVARDKTSPGLRGKPELLPAGQPPRICLMSADCVHSGGAKQCSNAGVDILVKVILHSAIARSEGCCFPKRSFVQDTLRVRARSISSG